MNLYLKRYGIPALALIIAFAAGRYTMRSSVEKEYALKYDQQLHEEILKVETQWQTRLSEETSSLRRQLEEATKTTVVTDKTTTTNPNGTIVVKEHTETNTKKKKTETVVVDKNKKEQANGGSAKEERAKKDEKATKSVESRATITPPPSWRVYGAAQVSRPLHNASTSYGAGGMYDLGPINFGGYSLYNFQDKYSTLGITLGVSF
jgi:hypothetical protein